MLLIVLWAAVGALVLHASYYLWVGLFAPILDVQPFRQAQTAISAYWALHDGLTLATRRQYLAIHGLFLSSFRSTSGL